MIISPAQLDTALVFFPGSVGLYLPTGSSVLHEHYCCYCVPKLEGLKLRLVERESQGEVLIGHWLSVYFRQPGRPIIWISKADSSCVSPCETEHRKAENDRT